MRIERWLIMAAALCAAALPAAAAASNVAVSEDYGATAWRTRDAGLTVIVDARLTGLREGDRFIPVPIALGVDGDGSALSLTPENFTLLDAEGRAIAAAGFEEFRREYGKAGFDRRMLRAFPIPIGSRFETSTRVRSNFYPPVGGGLRDERVEVPRFGWFADVLYFPAPTAKDGPLTLRITAAGLEHPVEVRFVLPGVPVRTASD